MRLLFSLGAAGCVALVSGLAIRNAGRALDVLGPQMDLMASDWDSEKVPLGRRVVTILLSDADASFDPFALAPEKEEGLLEASGGWLRRNLIGGNASLQTPTALARAFSDSTQLIAWTHKGFASAGEAEMSREIEKAILKAHDAGAEINIVAQGKASRAVLAALMRVQGLERGGSKVGANKVMLLGVNASRLGAGFAKPSNVLELAAVWSTREVGSPMRIQVYDDKRAGAMADLDALWPGLAEGGDSVEKNARLLRGFTESPETLDHFIARQEALLRDAREKKAAEDEERARALAAVEAKARPAPPAPPVRAAAPPPRAAPPRPAAGAGAAADRNGWPSTELRDYSMSMDGTDIGWLFSAPARELEYLRQEHMSVTLDNDRTTGLSSAQCSQYLRLTAVNAKKLGPGERLPAILKLWDDESRVSDNKRMDAVKRLKVRGHPAYVFKTTSEPDRGLGETSYFVVETGAHLIYLVLSSQYAPEKREACVKSYTALYQGIADSIRPRP